MARRTKPWRTRLQESVFEVIAHVTGLPSSELQSNRRTKYVVRVRWLAMALLRRRGLSLAEIGDVLARDHTTVLHGLQAWSELCRKEAEWEDLYANALSALDAKEKSEPRTRRKKEKKLVTYPLKAPRYFNLYKAECMVCGFNDVVEVHHRLQKGDSQFNDPAFVLVLCPNHHRLLHQGDLFIGDVVRLQKDHRIAAREVTSG